MVAMARQDHWRFCGVSWMGWRDNLTIGLRWETHDAPRLNFRGIILGPVHILWRKWSKA